MNTSLSSQDSSHNCFSRKEETRINLSRGLQTSRGIYSRLTATRTLYNSNLPLTRARSNFHFPSDRFLYNLPSITRTPGNTNFFLFPLKVKIIGSRVYYQINNMSLLTPGGYSWQFLVWACHSILQILTLFQTK